MAGAPHNPNPKVNELVESFIMKNHETVSTMLRNKNGGFYESKVGDCPNVDVATHGAWLETKI